jgi:hypothetical protein
VPAKPLYLIALVASLITPPLCAQQFVYPAKGQSAQQQNRDEGECYVWARNRTGIDPAAGPQTVAVQSEPSGEIVRGAARGAVGGAIIGGIAGDAGRGAAAGAVFGGIKSGVRQNRAQQQAVQQAQASGQDQFQRAFGACLEGRGYNVR